MRLFKPDFDNLLCIPDDCTATQNQSGIPLLVSLIINIKGFAIQESSSQESSEVWAAVSVTHNLAALGNSKDDAISRLREVVTMYVQGSGKIDTWSGLFYLPAVRLRLKLLAIYCLVRWGWWPKAGCAFTIQENVELTGPWE